MTAARIRLDDLTSDALDALYDELEAHRNAPVLRHCLMPGCLREYDARATLAGQPPARESWSCDGWRQMRPTIATGHICPDHVSLVEEHRPRWDLEQPEGHAQLRCACGWVSARHRWPRACVAAWQDHLIAAADTTPPRPEGHRPMTEDERDHLIDLLPDGMTLWADDEEATTHFADRTLARWLDDLGHPRAVGHGYCRTCGPAITCPLAAFYDAVASSMARELNRIGALRTPDTTEETR